MHGSEQHNRDGFATVRIMAPLLEALPALVHTGFTVKPIGTDRDEAAEVIPAPHLPEPPDLLPAPDDWRTSVCHLRFFSIDTEEPDFSTAPDPLTVSIACGFWGIDDVDEPIARLVGGRAASSASKQFAEMVASWSITVGCEECVRSAIGRTAIALVRGVRLLTDAVSYAFALPLATLPTELFRSTQVVRVEEVRLSGEVTKTHRLETAGQIDPRTDRALAIRGLNPAEVDQTLSDLAYSVYTLSMALEISSYTLFMAQAYRSLYLEHDPSSAVLLAAQACENLLDIVLLHLLWWDGVGHIEAGRIIADGVVKRVQKYYSRLGGTWDITSSVPLSNWRTSVADKRNRVAHGGRRALEKEGLEAISAARELRVHLMRVSDTERARANYPVLARILYPASGSGTRRQREASDFYYHQSRGYESFRYYRALANRERWRANGNPILPTIEHSGLLVTVHKYSEILEWWIYDPETHHVISAEDPLMDVEAIPDLVGAYRPQIRAGMAFDTFPVGVDADLSPKAGSDWQDALVCLPHLSPARPVAGA